MAAPFSMMMMMMMQLLLLLLWSAWLIDGSISKSWTAATASASPNETMIDSNSPYYKIKITPGKIYLLA